MEKHFISEDDVQLLGVFMGIKEIELSYNKCQFDTSWLWLMPVVEKILSLEKHYDDEPSDVWHQVYLRTFGMRDENTGCFMVRFDGCVLFASETLLRATLSACLDFIKIYNNCSDSFRACQKIN